jgi:hypothetical protein
MLDINVITKIRKSALDSMKSDSDDQKIASVWKKIVFVSIFYILPLSASVLSWIKCLKLSTMEGFIGSGIAIFTGLFFSLLISIGAKVRSEKENPNKDESNFQQFKTSMKQIANIILYVIMLGISIFLLMLINSILKSNCYPLIEKVITAITLFLLVRFIVSLFFMMQRFYFLVRDEINNIL